MGWEGVRRDEGELPSPVKRGQGGGARGEVIHISTPSSAVHYFLFHPLNPCKTGGVGVWGAGSALVKNGSHYELDPSCR